jgi:nucleotidyltransferase substrate binding protein (TIGR01987 family)
MGNKTTDVRWQQRFANFQKALDELRESVTLAKSRSLSKLETQGIIQEFEFTHELAWNVMRDFFKFQGDSSIAGSRDATRAAFKAGLVLDGETWMDMIESRNLTSHTHNKSVSREIGTKIIHEYFNLFESFATEMAARAV